MSWCWPCGNWRLSTSYRGTRARGHRVVVCVEEATRLSLECADNNSNKNSSSSSSENSWLHAVLSSLKVQHYNAQIHPLRPWVPNERTLPFAPRPLDRVSDQVTYDFNRARMLTEPMLLAGFFLACFLVAMMVGRVDMRIRKGGAGAVTAKG